MSLLGGNLQSKLLLLIPNLRNPRFVTHYSTNPSSSPSRYIPQNPSSPSSCSISQHRNLKDPTLTNKHTQPPTFIEEDDDNHLLLYTSKTEDDAEKAAAGAIAARAITAVELQNKLAAKGFAPNVIDKVLAGMQTKGYINDYLYAESFSQSRWSSSTWGPKRITQALRRKGVSQADAKKATDHVFQSDDVQGSGVLGMSKVAMDRLFVQASKQWVKSQSVEHDKRKARLVRWLQYRGFSWPVISFILNKLETHS